MMANAGRPATEFGQAGQFLRRHLGDGDRILAAGTRRAEQSGVALPCPDFWTSA